MSATLEHQYIRPLCALYLLVTLLGVLAIAFPGMAAAASGDTVPHGGYSTATDACLQCHDVHEAAGDYVLGRWSTVTYVCGSCHTLYQTPPAQLPGGGYNIAGQDDPALAVQWDGMNANLLAGTYGPEGTGITADNESGVGERYINYDPDYTGLEAPIPGWSLYDVTAASGDANTQVGMSAPYEVYEKPLQFADGSDGLPAHRLGTAFSLGDTVNHADGVIDSLDYIPGGANRLTAIRTPSAADSAASAGYEYMLPTTSVSEFPVSLNGGLYCASCHSPHGQFSGFGVTGDIVNGGVNNSNMISPLILNKLLSTRPNHSATPADFGQDGNWTDDGGREYCGKCHDDRVSGSTYAFSEYAPDDSFAAAGPGGSAGGSKQKLSGGGADGGHRGAAAEESGTQVSASAHTHPDFACLLCHGAESIVADGSAPRRDFPHTSSNPNMLTQEPDGLCINCHGPGALPLP